MALLQLAVNFRMYLSREVQLYTAVQLYSYRYYLGTIIMILIVEYSSYRILTVAALYSSTKFKIKFSTANRCRSTCIRIVLLNLVLLVLHVQLYYSCCSTTAYKSITAVHLQPIVGLSL
jgi:hypothetical protein